MSVCVVLFLGILFIGFMRCTGSISILFFLLLLATKEFCEVRSRRVVCAYVG